MTVTVDDFLGGKIKLAQLKDGYRATSDSVLLASAVQVKKGESVLDVGTGNGVVLFCLSAREKDLKMTGVDIQPELIELAKKNEELNHVSAEFIVDDISKKTSLIHARQFNHVVTNPPYYADGRVRENKQQQIAFHEVIKVDKWISFCLKHIRAGGTFTMIHQMTALPDILTALNRSALGAIEVIPLVKDISTPAKRVIVRGRLGSKKPFILRNPFVLHAENKRDYTSNVEAVLRNGLPLDAVL